MKSKKGGIRRKSNKARKSLDTVSVFFYTIMEHQAGVLVTKAQENGVFIRAKPLGPVLRETLQEVKHPFALSGPDEQAWHCQQNTRLK